MAWWREKEKKEIESSVAKCKKRREEAPREERRKRKYVGAVLGIDTDSLSSPPVCLPSFIGSHE